MQVVERSHLRKLLSSDDFNRQRGVAMSITVTYLPSSPIRRTLRRWDVEQSPTRRSPSLRWISVAMTTLVVECSTDFFVASHWLERSSCRFSVTLLVFSRADHSTSQVLTTFYVVFISNFLLKARFKSLQAHQTSHWLVQLPWRHTPRLLVMHVVFRSLLKIFEYDAKQALSKHASSCSAIRSNYQRQPPLMGFTYIGP